MLILPATPSQVLGQVIVPALANLLTSKYDSDPARVLLLAIALQESGLRTRYQEDGGPAHGLWQTEQGGAQDVLFNGVSQFDAKALCDSCAVSADAHDVYSALATDDLFACAFARLMLYCDHYPLPAVGDEQGSWDYYQRNWRPGEPRPQDWSNNYALAQQALEAFHG